MGWNWFAAGFFGRKCSVFQKKIVTLQFDRTKQMEQTVKISNINLHYRLSGSGPAMILMHGWGCNCTTLASLERVCALSHTVYNLDLPGFGLSQ